MSTIKPNAMIDQLTQNAQRLDKSAVDASYVGGVHIAGFGIPNQFLGLDLRTQGQKQAQEEPGRYREAMAAFLRALKEAKDAIHAVGLSGR
ncbi:MAG: hypothetical protein VKP62_09700 [Candidatus Sericytochromatia bacterium]|nr:hypothetical protein [Candidatus Sericytochromatia bacterium]